MSRVCAINTSKFVIPREHLVNSLTRHVYQFIYQFGSKKAVFLKLMKNIAPSEKTQKPKKRGVIANPLVFLRLSKNPVTIFQDRCFQRLTHHLLRLDRTMVTRPRL